MPPRPCIGSTTTQATLSPKAGTPPHSTRSTAGSQASNGRRNSGQPQTPSAPSDVPWYPPRNAITSLRPVASSAVFSASSTAPAPVSDHSARVRPNGATDGQPLGQPDPHRGRMEVTQPVQQLAGLGAYRLDHARVGVADRGDAEPRRQVEIATAVRIPDVAALRALPHRRRRAGIAQRPLVAPPALDQIGGRHRRTSRRATSCATYPAMLGFSFRRRIE